MAVAIADVRVQIADEPRLCVRPGAFEPLAAPADGVTSAFRLRFTKAILSSVQVYLQVTTAPAAPATYQIVQPADVTYGYTVALDGNGLPTVTFAKPPPRAAVLATTYLVTAFTDAQITVYLTNNQRSSDQMTLYAVHYAIIPAILANREAMLIYRIGERTEDPAQFASALRDVRKQLRADLLEDAAEDAAAFSGTMGWHGHGGLW